MTSENRVERLLALLLLQQMKQAGQRDKVLQLSLVGFTTAEIADLLQTSAAVVSQRLYETRKGPVKRRTSTSRKSK